MPILKVKTRPTVIFDAANEQHRKWAHEFIQTKTWGRCPVKLEVGDESEDVTGYISRKLMEFYLNREFNVQ